MLKKYPVWIAISLLFSLFIMLCCIRGWDRVFFANLLDGLPTEIVGIVITLIFVQILFDKYNENKQKAEERQKILRFHKILKLYIDRYERLLSNMITNSRQIDRYYKLQDSFDIKQLKYAHNPCLLVCQSCLQSNIDVFLQNEINLRTLIISFIENVDFKYHQEIYKALFEYIDTSINFDVHEAIKLESTTIANQRLSNSSEYLNFIYNLIDYHIEEYLNDLKKDKTAVSNALFKYVVLYKMINKEKEGLLEYLNQISTLKQ